MQSCYHPLKKWWVYSVKTSHFYAFFLPLNERYGRTSIPVNGRTGTEKESKFILKIVFSLTNVGIFIFQVLMIDTFCIDITAFLTLSYFRP